MRTNTNYARRTRVLRGLVTAGKTASRDFERGYYSDSADAVNDSWYWSFPTSDQLHAMRRRGFRAARDLRVHSGRATIADIASAELVPQFSASSALVEAYADA